MFDDKVEKHHLLFYITTIIIIFLIEYFIPDLIFLKTELIGFVFYFIILVVFTNLLFFVIYWPMIMYFCGIRHKTNNPISQRDFLLTSPAIITAFLIKDLLDILNSLAPEYSFILTISIISFLYLGVYKINKWILPFLIP